MGGDGAGVVELGSSLARMLKVLCFVIPILWA